MNTEFRNKILNRYVESAEQEITQEKDAFNDAREKVDIMYPKAFELAKLVVNRAYPKEDVDTCKSLKKKYGQPLDVVAKDKCFYFSYAKENLAGSTNGTAGTVNTGGGGGGGQGGAGRTEAGGGSGIVMIRYKFQ